MKIKIFLYAHLNHVGAFNLSALHLAQNLNKEEFEVYALSLGRGNLKYEPIKEVNVFRCFYPAKISNYLGILWGIYHADVVFVMRGNHYRFVRACIKFFNKKSFKRQGNKIDDSVLGSIASTVGGEAFIADSFNFCNQVFSPNRLIGVYNKNRWGIKFHEKLFLPPFINVAGFTKINKSGCVRNVVFIGNDMRRKNIDFFCQLAASFPHLNFHIVGSAPSITYFENKSINLNYQGSMTPIELNEFLDQIDLHCFTSRSEGFGKVTVEVAAKGIPSILFADYGAVEWLVNGKEGIIVETDEEYRNALKELVENSSKFQKLQKGTSSLVSRFSMRNQLMNYERIIKDLYAS